MYGGTAVFMVALHVYGGPATYILPCHVYFALPRFVARPCFVALPYIYGGLCMIYGSPLHVYGGPAMFMVTLPSLWWPCHDSGPAMFFGPSMSMAALSCFVALTYI